MEDAECITDDDLLRFVSGAFDDARTAEIREHIDRCDDCRELLAIAGKEAAALDGAELEAAESDAILAVGVELGEHFRIEGEIGRGSMGVVYAATSLALDRRVAVKVLNDAAAARKEAVSRFLREIRVASNLESPHAVQVMDVGQLRSGAPYMVMELLEGKNLERVLGEDGPLDVDVAVRYVLEACHAIGEAHAAGIVHRDVTLANLFLADADPEPIVKVLDFGLAKGGRRRERARGGASTVMTRADAMMGTPLYMSPEQLISSRDVDARTDVWALGVVLYRLVTSKYPFEGAHLLALLGRIMGAPPILPTIHRPDLAPSIERVILRCLSRDLTTRYVDANEVGRALTEALEADGPPTTRKRSQQLSKTVEMPDKPQRRSLAPKLASTAILAPPVRPPPPAPPLLPPPSYAAAPVSRGGSAAWSLAAVGGLAMLIGTVVVTALIRRSPSPTPDLPPPAQTALPDASIDQPATTAAPPASADEPSPQGAADPAQSGSATSSARPRRPVKPVTTKPDTKPPPTR